MQDNELEIRVRYLKDVSGLSFRQMESQLGICRNRLSRIYAGSWKEPEPPQGRILDPHRDLIAHWFQECPTLKAIQIHRRLIDRSIAVDYTTVAKYTAEFRQRKKGRIHWPLEFLPGEEAQVDWFFLNHPILGRLSGFAMILSYSRYVFAHFYPRHSFEFFIDGHLRAFASFGGHPLAMRYDNLRSVVLKRQPLTYNPSFLDFARHCEFEIRLCNLAAGNEKGRVERLIRTIRGTFCNTASHHQSTRAINSDLHEWVNRKNGTTHRVTGRPPCEMLQEERLRPSPDSKWPNIIRATLKTPIFGDL